MSKIKRAILSCHDKSGVVELAQVLRDFDVELISTSGTLKVLREAEIEAQSIADFTGIPELMDGRVKSLHPKVHAGLLGIRDRKLHEEQLHEYDMQWVDLVVVNLQPMKQLIERPGAALEDVLEQTDIGGAAMIRSGAKNFRYVTVVVNPQRYSSVIHDLKAHDGEVSFTNRHRLAQEAFACTAAYDHALATYLEQQDPPQF
jgi:phosphoribosylaminoimidazolecarboxamide formyltransferase / IMP cyclohydrolase